MTAEPLSDEEVDGALAELPGWKRDGGEIVKWFKFDGFPGAVAFVERLVEPAERMNHHPDIEIHERRVRVGLHTWSASAITSKDLELARETEVAASG